MILSPGRKCHRQAPMGLYPAQARELAPFQSEVPPRTPHLPAAARRRGRERMKRRKKMTVRLLQSKNALALRKRPGVVTRRMCQNQLLRRRAPNCWKRKHHRCRTPSHSAFPLPPRLRCRRPSHAAAVRKSSCSACRRPRRTSEWQRCKRARKQMTMTLLQEVFLKHTLAMAMQDMPPRMRTQTTRRTAVGQLAKCMIQLAVQRHRMRWSPTR
mmetsp:Transcript_21092/g.48840  ORF Transcript_21092/g.48840 Transcript_21092/m.48840 type:complete len:213 (-) Transcript_21092:917-1555(-)